VVKVFSGVENFLEVDENVMKTAVQFLINAQGNDGGFRVVGKIFHDEMVGGAAQSANPVAGLTGYIIQTLSYYLMQYSSSDVTTLADYAVGSDEDVHFTAVKSAIGKGLVYLRNLGIASLSRFELMLLLKAESHVLLNHGRIAIERRLKQEDVVNALAGLKVATVGKDGGPLEYYPLEAPSTVTATTTAAEKRWRMYHRQNRDRAIDIEMTGYAVQILTGFKRIAEALPAVKWLGTKRRNNGGFISSTDTIVALDAMGQFSVQLAQATSSAVAVVKLLWNSTTTNTLGETTSHTMVPLTR
jgi:hypothetical protein